MLYLIATPIGNLKDITYRAVEILHTCDYLLCEDTRHSKVLLTHYGIQKPLRSFHAHNEAGKENEVIEDLKKGLNIALLSDAGTPGVCDPGYLLGLRCRQEKIPFTALPGPCAAILGLTLSGLKMDRFQFMGFLPKTASDLKKTLIDMLGYSGTSICYESPHRLVETLEVLSQCGKDHSVCVGRELTKIYEEALRGSAQELLEHFQKFPPKGEIVLLIEGKEKVDYSHMSPIEHVNLLQQQYGISQKEAIKMAAELRDVPKREIYKLTNVAK